MDDCPLCPLQLSASNHDLLWRSQQAEGYDGVLAAASAMGLDLSLRQARAHFEKHFPRQAPAAIIRHDKALMRMNKTTARRRGIADLLFRVPGLNGDIVGRSLHWHGDVSKRNVAARAALRDLKWMMGKDQVHRVFLTNLPGSAARPVDNKGLFFLGRGGRSYVEQLNNVVLRPGDLVAEQRDVGDWRSVYPQCQAHTAIASLQKQMPGNIDMRFTYVRETPVGWDYRNWLGHNLMPQFHDTMNQGNDIRANGLVALSVKRGEQFYLLPFYYHLDSGARSMSNLLDDLLAPMRLERSGLVRDFYPQMSTDTVIPTVVICQSRERLSKLRQAALQSRPPQYERILSIACTADSIDLESEIFSTLFARTTEKLSLLQALARYYESRPVAGHLLQWQGVRSVPEAKAGV